MSRSTIEPTALSGPTRAGLLPPRYWWPRLQSSVRPAEWFWRTGPDSEDWSVRLAGFAARCDRAAGAVVDIAVSSELVFACVAPAAAGAMDDRALRAYVRTQLAFYIGEADGPWAVATCSRPNAALALGLPRRVLDALIETAAKSHVHVRHVRPWWTIEFGRVLRSASTAHVALVASEPGYACGLQIERGRLTRVAADRWGNPREATSFDADRFAASQGLQGRLHLITAPEERA